MPYSYRLEAELDPCRKIKDINSKYCIVIQPSADLRMDFYTYSKYFYKAAHAIAKMLIEGEETPSIAQLDTYIFPLTFLYRHSLELIMKAIAFQSISDENQRRSFIRDTFHDLSKILGGILLFGNGNRTAEELTWLKTYFADLSNMDKASDSFRYPFHIRRNNDIFINREFVIERVFENQTSIDLVKFANKFEAAYEILNLWYLRDHANANEWRDLDPIFIETGGGYYCQSVVGYSYRHQDYYPYVEAYIQTAGFLRSRMTDATDRNDNGIAECFFFPMCYLYRNAIELVLKEVWFEDTREVTDHKLKLLNKKKHSIIGLWNKIRGWDETYFQQDNSNADTQNFFNNIEACCTELHNYDNDASKFRYPCNKQLELYFKGKTTIDYMNIAEFMEGLFDALDCIDAELSSRNDFLNDMEAEMHSYWY